MNKKGFTLIELMVYMAILGIVSGLFISILGTSTRLQLHEVASNEVSNQMNFVLQTIQRLVRESSNIETIGADDTSTVGTTEIVYLKLRMKDSQKDPTCISLVEDNATAHTGSIRLTQGAGTNPQYCKASSPTDAITTPKVDVVTSPSGLTFTRFSNAPAHDIVQVDLTLNYNTTNPQSAFAKTLSTAIGRVSAATFDSDLFPDAADSRNVGGLNNKWLDGYFSGDVTVGPNGYLRFDKSGAGAPMAGDCTQDTVRGRFYLDITNNRLYICTGVPGWKYAALQ